MKIDAKLKDLNLIKSEIDAAEPLKKIFKIFENETVPGVIVYKDEKYFQMLSKIRFFQIMSHEFMHDLYSKRSVESFFQENGRDFSICLQENESVLTGADLALRRSETYRQDPIIVEDRNKDLKLLDFYELLFAQTKVHMLTLNSLKEANEFKKEILGVAAHDLRNPLNAIMGFSQIIGELAGNNSDLKTYSTYINSEARSMNDLFSELLKSAVNDAIEYEINKSDFNLVELTQFILNSFKHSFELKKQTFNFNTSTEHLIINADKQKLKEVIENLISNAIKYSPHKKNIKVSVDQTESAAVLEVEDEGLGLTKDDLSKIFRKYQKLSARPTNNESSTGLGLFIVKRIIDNHGGEIKVKSEIGKGSTFTITIPHNGQHN